MRRTALLFAAVVLAASLLPAGPPDTGGFPLDKLLHVTAYAVLAWLLVHDYPVLVVVLLTAGFGLAVEGAQAVVPWRTASVLDATVNLAGAVVGAVVRD